MAVVEDVRGEVEAEIRRQAESIGDGGVIGRIFVGTHEVVEVIRGTRDHIYSSLTVDQPTIDPGLFIHEHRHRNHRIDRRVDILLNIDKRKVRLPVKPNSQSKVGVVELQRRSVVWICEHAAVVADEVVGLAVVEDEEIEVYAEDLGDGEEGKQATADRANSPLSV